jgi:pyruvate ferredoxin oxidoreductase gamma subunit
MSGLFCKPDKFQIQKEVGSVGEIRIHGRGGQGTVIAAEMLANAFVSGGQYASVFPSFGVERRGSAVMAFARFGDKPIRERTRVYRPDTLLMLDQASTENIAYYEGFKNGGTIIANTAHAQNIINMDLKQQLLGTVDGVAIALEEIGIAITNTCMLGAYARVTQYVKLDDLKKALALYFERKVLEKNIRSLERGYQDVRITHYSKQDAAPKAQNTDRDPAAIQPPPSAGVFESAWSDTDRKIVTAKTGEWRYRRPELIKSACRKCGWCSVYCPVGCMKIGEDGYYHPDLDYCKGCGVCANECPALAIKMKAEEVI